MSARAIGSAAISFGMVTIPVKLYTTAESASQISFNQLEKATGARVKQQYISGKTGEIVSREQMVKGYEFAKGQYVTFTPDELKAIEAKSNHAVEINEFVPAEDVDPLIFDKSYYIGPDKGGARAYHLLREAMTQTKRVAVASYASRGKGYLVMVRPFENGLIMEQLRYRDEIKDFSEVPVDEVEIKKDELKLAIQLIEQVSTKEFKHANYRDEVRERVLAMIQDKVDGKDITMAPEEESEGKIIDLMAALKKSLAEKGKVADKKPAKRATEKAGLKNDAGPATRKAAHR